MRFDILDEYSTLVPFGLGVSKQNRVVQYPATATKAVNSGAITNCVSRLEPSGSERDFVPRPAPIPNSHSAGTSAGAPLFLIKSTRNFAGSVVLAFRSTT